MKLFRSFIACFSTYSKIPMPNVELDSEDMKYVFIFFPLVGIVIGGLEYFIFFVCKWFSMPVFFRAAISTVIPVMITGGIHVDGYMDTMDALSSYGDKEKKLLVMKDPHAGAFSIIKLSVYGITYLAFMYLINEKSIIFMCLSFVLSRILSGISVVTINNAKDAGMLHAVKKNSKEKTVLISLIVMLIAVVCFIAALDVFFAVLISFMCVLFYFAYRKKVIKEFGGITGDTSGFYLCVMELVLLIVISFGGMI